MQIQIDQSGKIEQTNRNTVIALTNNIKYTIMLKKKDKRIIEKTLRKLDITKLRSPLIFSVLISIVISESKVCKSVLIDTEYPGYNIFIKQKVEEFLSKINKKNIPSIKFGFVGKESNSDYLASMVARGKIKPNRIVTLQEVLTFINTNKKSRSA